MLISARLVSRGAPPTTRRAATRTALAVASGSPDQRMTQRQKQHGDTKEADDRSPGGGPGVCSARRRPELERVPEPLVNTGGVLVLPPHRTNCHRPRWRREAKPTIRLRPLVNRPLQRYGRAPHLRPNSILRATTRSRSSHRNRIPTPPARLPRAGKGQIDSVGLHNVPSDRVCASAQPGEAGDENAGGPIEADPIADIGGQIRGSILLENVSGPCALASHPKADLITSTPLIA